MISPGKFHPPKLKYEKSNWLLFQFFIVLPGLAETQLAMCCAWVTTTLRNRMTLNVPCPLNELLSTESTTVRAGSMTSPCCGSKAQRATVWRSTLTLVQCVCQSKATSGRRDLLPVWSLAGASQVHHCSDCHMLNTVLKRVKCFITLSSQIGEKYITFSILIN